MERCIYLGDEREPGYHVCRAGHGLVTPADCTHCPDHANRVRLGRVFDRVVVVNLLRRPDRLAAFYDQPWPFHAEPFEAVDHEICTPPDTWREKPGGHACNRSHARMLEQALMDGVKTLLVLEDDALIKPDFAERVEDFFQAVPDDWEGIMLGGQHRTAPEAVSPGVVRVKNAVRTHAYAVRGRYMLNLYREWCSARAVTYNDIVMGTIQAWHRVYAPATWLVGQRESDSDVMQNRSPEMWWVAPEQKVLYWLKCPADVALTLQSRYGVHLGHPLDYAAAMQESGGTYESARKALAKWLARLQWECSQGAGTPGIWGWAAASDVLKTCWAGTIVEVVANTLSEAVAVMLREAAKETPC